ncbi:autotransporter outer membrane beta-barrel domain-containing protein [Variovorax sp. J31P207]|uniref:autotransporter outer membrane beta-barrel domain-containing protein n=1 Tax=Variovorax sp. J31P207 TaxID=3053510 RepID=UPI0033657D16
MSSMNSPGLHASRCRAKKCAFRKSTPSEVGAASARSSPCSAPSSSVPADADSLLQCASQRYEIRSDGNPSVSGKASGFMISTEGGKAFAVTERCSIEPQAQLAWQQTTSTTCSLAARACSRLHANIAAMRLFSSGRPHRPSSRERQLRRERSRRARDPGADTRGEPVLRNRHLVEYRWRQA